MHAPWRAFADPPSIVQMQTAANVGAKVRIIVAYQGPSSVSILANLRKWDVCPQAALWV